MRWQLDPIDVQRSTRYRAIIFDGHVVRSYEDDVAEKSNAHCHQTDRLSNPVILVLRVSFRGHRPNEDADQQLVRECEKRAK